MYRCPGARRACLRAASVPCAVWRPRAVWRVLVACPGVHWRGVRPTPPGRQRPEETDELGAARGKRTRPTTGRADGPSLKRDLTTHSRPPCILYSLDTES